MGLGDRVIIWSTRGDGTADRVQNAVRDLGVQPVRVDTDGYGETFALEWRFGRDARMVVDGDSFDASDIRAIYYRRPSLSEIPSDSRDFGTHETWYFVRSVLQATRASWLNHPAAVEAAEDKILQL